MLDGIMKRESGENPEQTRCCKLHQEFLDNTQTTVANSEQKAVNNKFVDN